MLFNPNPKKFIKTLVSSKSFNFSVRVSRFIISRYGIHFSRILWKIFSNQVSARVWSRVVLTLSKVQAQAKNGKPPRKNEKVPKERHIPFNKKNNKKDIPIKKKKKIRDLKSLGEVLISRKPNTSLSTIVKKRYRTLSDRLKSLDRCLTVVHLFAALPLSRAYIASTNSSRKVQTDKRRTLYQVEVNGHTISYSTPCALQQVSTDDFKVILIFLEFYEVLLGSVLKRLYGLISVRYPLDCDSHLEVLETDHAVSIYVAGQAWMLTDESDLRLAQLQHALTEFVRESANGSIGENKDDESDDKTKDWKIFKYLKIFLNPEVPKESLLFVISAFGGAVSWEGGPFTDAESDITHQICERPTKTSASRVCVHTRWFYDCVSRLGVLRAHDYLVGREPSSYTAFEELKGDVTGNRYSYVFTYSQTVVILGYPTEEFSLLQK